MSPVPSARGAFSGPGAHPMRQVLSRLTPRRCAQPLLELLGRQRRADEVPVGVVAVQRAQHLIGGVVLNSLRHHLDVRLWPRSIVGWTMAASSLSMDMSRTTLRSILISSTGSVLR